MQEADRILHPDLISHMGPWALHGIAAWSSWVRFIRSQRVSELGLELVEVTAKDNGTIVAVGRWTALKDGRMQSSAEVSASYRIEDSMIREIWTTPANYGFILGDFVNRRFGILGLVARMGIRSFWLAAKQSLTFGRESKRRSIPPQHGK